MRVAIVRRGFSTTGGAEAYLLRLAAGLAAAGHEPVLVTSSEWPQEAWPHGRITRLEGHTPTAFASSFEAHREGFDVTLSLDRTPGCDVYRAGDGVHAAWLKRRAAFEPPMRCFLRRWNPKHGALLLLEREVFRRSRLIIANSNMVASEIQQWHGLGTERVRVVYNGLAGQIPSVGREVARESLGLDPATFCVLFVGTGWERKGLKFAIRAVEALPFDAMLVVAGRGDVGAFRSKRVRHLGPTRDLPTIFAAADVFTLPTIYDPFSNACLEALAAGLPVITTTANGFSEIISPGIHGDVVEPGDANALGEKFLQWRDLHREETAGACRSLAAAYSIESNVEQTVRVLTDAMQ